MTTWVVTSELYIGSLAFLLQRRIWKVEEARRASKQARQEIRRQKEELKALRELGVVSDGTLLQYIIMSERCHQLDIAHSLTLRDLDPCRIRKYHHSARF